MADRSKTKDERRQAAGHATKAERKEAKLRRKQRSGSASPPLEAVTPAEGASAAEDTSGDAIEQRLARLEQAVVAQSQLSEELLEKLDEVLEEARKSARHAKTAAVGPDPAGEAPAGEASAGEAPKYEAPEGEAPSPPPEAP